MKSKATIADVASHAGVSKVTVSYVLNGRSADVRISHDTAERVRASALHLDYRPNPVARMLKTRRSGAIAVVFQYANLFATGSAFVVEAMRGVCEAATEAGLDLMLHTRASADPAEEVARLTDGRVDGILVLRDGDDPVLAGLFDQSRVPVVSFFGAAGERWVDADNAAGSRLAVDHLRSLGHRRLLFLSGAPGSLAASERRDGFLAAGGEVVLDARDLTAQAASFASADRPTGVVAWSDDAALDLLNRLPELGLRCPEDVSVIGFDSLAPAARAAPALTSVAQPIVEIARAGVETLVEAMADRPAPSRRFPVELTLRASTAPFLLSSRPLSNDGTPS